MKANKAHKRLAHAEELIADVLERYAADAPDIRQHLLDANAAVGQAKSVLKLLASSEKKKAPKKPSSRKSAVTTPPAKAAKKHATTKRDYEG